MRSLWSLTLMVLLLSPPVDAGLRKDCRLACEQAAVRCQQTTGQPMRKCRRQIRKQCRQQGLAVCVVTITTTTQPGGVTTTSPSTPTTVHPTTTTLKGEVRITIYGDIRSSITGDAVMDVFLIADGVPAAIPISPQSFTANGVPGKLSTNYAPDCTGVLVPDVGRSCYVDFGLPQSVLYGTLIFSAGGYTDSANFDLQ